MPRIMTADTPQPPLPVDTRVRFNELFLARLSPKERRRYENRVGTVTGYRMGADEPIVFFPRDGRRPEVRLFEVPLGRLEIVQD